MKKIVTILVLSLVLASCNQKTEPTATPTNTGSSQVEAEKLVETESKDELPFPEAPKIADLETHTFVNTPELQGEEKSLIKAETQGDKVVLKTPEFDLTLPAEFKDFYFGVSGNSYSLRRGNSSSYATIGKTSKKEIEFKKTCAKKYENTTEAPGEDDCFKVMFEEDLILATFPNGDVLEMFVPVEGINDPENEKFTDILEKNTKNPPKKDDGIILTQYLRENITLKK